MDNKTTAQHHGVVFTRVPVVEFMLDLVGYHPDEQLHTLRLLEPSFGDGRFVIQAAGRLLQSWRAAGGQDPHDLIDAIRAVEIDPQSVAQFSQQLVDYLVTQRIAPDAAQKLADAWLISGDYLTTKFDHLFRLCCGQSTLCATRSDTQRAAQKIPGALPHHGLAGPTYISPSWKNHLTCCHLRENSVSLPQMRG